VSIETLRAILSKVATESHHQLEDDRSDGSPLDLALNLLIAEAISEEALAALPSDCDEVLGGTLLVCGSGYIMSSIYSALGIVHPK
jgi:hypothetical protein